MAVHVDRPTFALLYNRLEVGVEAGEGAVGLVLRTISLISTCRRPCHGCVVARAGFPIPEETCHIGAIAGPAARWSIVEFRRRVTVVGLVSPQGGSNNENDVGEFGVDGGGFTWKVRWCYIN